MNTSILPNLESEAYDVPKKFLNIDNEVFTFHWDGREYVVHPGEVKDYPKYLVNYAAMHLARKIFKRQAFANFKGTEHEKGNANIKFVDAKSERELQEKMVALNYPEKIVDVKNEESPILETRIPIEPAKVLPRCEKCNREFKSPLGLSNHNLRMHKTA